MTKTIVSKNTHQNKLSDKLNIAKFNCFVYAFGLDTDPDFIFFDNTPPKKSIDGMRIEYLIKYKILKPVEIAEKGDYIIYTKDNQVKHIGIVLDQNTIISCFLITEFPVIRKHEATEFFVGCNVDYYKKIPSEKIKEQCIK